MSFATDLGIGVPLEHGLQSTLVAMRLSERLDVDDDTAREAYYLCLLFYVGCTAGAELAADVFGSDNALTTFATPVRFGTRAEMLRGMLRRRRATARFGRDPSGADRARCAEAGSRVQGARRGGVRGGTDAVGPARAAGLAWTSVCLHR